MTYSVDLRSRVVSFIKDGGSKAEASRRFAVSMWCIHDWCCRKVLSPKKQGRRLRKLDWEKLRLHIAEHPDLILRERSEHFDVHINAIWYACRQMSLSHKKNFPVQGKRS